MRTNSTILFTIMLVLIILTILIPLQAGIVSKTYYFEKPRITHEEGFDQVELNDCFFMNDPGKPQLPEKYVKLLIPPGEEAVEITVSGSGKTIVGKGFNVYPCQYDIPLSLGAMKKFTEPDEETYASDKVYPAAIHSKLDTGYYRGHSIATVNIHPMEYIPISGELSYYSSLTVTITTQSTVNSSNSYSRFYRSDESTHKFIKSYVQNTEQLFMYPVQTNPREYYPYTYLIITSNYYADCFTDFIRFKKLQGYNTAIETKQNIYAAYPGMDNQERIRNCIIDYYQEYGIEYVLLGGDTEIVPHRNLFGHFMANAEPEAILRTDDIPADIYYGGLDRVGTGTGPDWNVDNDMMWGEYNVGDPLLGDITEADFLSEVYVGRISADTNAEFANALNKQIMYQKHPVQADNKKAIMVGEYLWLGGVGDTEKEEVRLGGNYDGYTTAGLEDAGIVSQLQYASAYPDSTWPIEDFLTKINSGTTFINHLGHGWTFGYMAFNTYEGKVDSINANGSNHNFFFVYSQSCYGSSFDNRGADSTYYADDCMTECFTTHEKGVLGVVGNSRYGLSGAGQKFDRYFFDAMCKSTDPIYTVGKMQEYSKVNSGHNYRSTRWQYYELNLFADPSLEFWKSDNLSSINSVTVQTNPYIGMYQLSVLVSPAVAGMRVSICTDTEIFGTALTNSSGIATIELSESLNEEVPIYGMVTKENYLPFEFWTGWFPSLWTGDYDTNWHDSRNWWGEQVPSAADDVIINSGKLHYPLIEGSNASCHDLQLDNGASLQINDVNLTINGNAVIRGELIMMLSNPKIYCYGDLTFDTYRPILGPNPVIEVYGNCEILSNIVMDEGLLKLTGSSNSDFICNTLTATLHNLTIQKFGASVNLSMNTDSKLKLLGDFVVANGAEFIAIMDTCYIECYGNVTSYGDLWNYVGTYVFAGTAQNINLSSTSFLNHASVINNSTLTLLSDLTIYGNLHFLSGNVDATNRTINIGGYWKPGSVDGFSNAGSTVVFDGYDDQVCFSTNFNNLVLNKGSGLLKIETIQSVHANSFEFSGGTIEVAGGSFIVDDLADINVKGSYLLQSGTISLTQDIGNSTDLDADIEIHAGTMTIQGGTDSLVDWACTRDITLEMDGGVLAFADNGIGLTETGYYLNAWITGGTIRVGGSFVVDRIGFYPAGGTIELTGTEDAVVTQHIASSIYNLKINKGSRSESERSSSRSITRSNTVTFTGDTIIDNDLNIYSGSLDIDSMYVYVGADLDVYGSLIMTNENAVLDISESAFWYNGSVNTITSGAINVGRNLSFYDDIGLNIGIDNTFSLTGSQPCNLKLYDDDASFGNLVIDKMSTVVYTGSGGHHLSVSGNMTITGESQVELENTTGIIDSLLSVEGILNCGFGSFISTRDMYLSGSLTVDDAGVIIGDDFIQETWGILTVDDGSFTLDAPYTGALLGFAGVVNLNSGVLQITNEGIQFGPSSQFYQTGGILKVGWGFKAISPNVFMPSAGYVELTGARSAEIQCNNGNYFHNLTFNKPSTSNAIYFMTDLTVNNDLKVLGGNATLMHHTLNVNRDVIIIGGRLSAGYEDDIINVSRNWTNYYGATGFIEGTGTVNFVSGLDATISTETFNLVNVNKPTQGPDLLHIAAGTTVTVDSTLSINTGCLKLDDNSILHVNDDIFISDYSGLNISSAGTDNTLNLGGNLYDYCSYVDATHGFTAHPKSTVIFDGDSTQVLYGAYSGMTFNSARVDKASGVVMHSNDISFTGNLEIVNGEWSFAVPEKTKNFFGDLYIETGGSFTDSTGTCNFLGNNDTGLGISGLALMPNISILKSAENYLYLNGNATFAGNTDISMLSGILSLNTHTLQFKGTLTLSEECAFTMYNGSVLSLGDNSAVNFGYGTSFISCGLTGNPATITSFDGHYAFTIGSDALLSAEHTVFEKMNYEGINVEPGALVDSLHCFKYCTFREGESGGVLLQMNASRDLNVYHADFPANTWGGAYNVSRYNPLGSIYFVDYSGAFAGDAFENDLYDNINWEILAPPAVPQNPETSTSGNEIVLSWDEVPGATGYNIYRSFTPGDPDSFELVGTTDSTTWSDAVMDLYPEAFYYVTAYVE